MNLAFPALFLLIVLLPGLIFRRVYNRGPAAPPPASLGDEIARSPIPAGVLHLVWGCLGKLIGHPVDIKSALALGLGNFGDHGSFFDEALDSVANHSVEVSLYFLSIYCAAALIGYVCHWIVWDHRLDLKFWFLRSSDYWYYFFRGEPPAPKPASPIEGIRVSAVVSDGTEMLIYRGIFHHYTGRGGQLDEIWLLSAERRPLSGDKPEDPLTEKYYRIPGDVLVLKASEVKTINLKYIDRASIASAEAAITTLGAGARRSRAG